MKTQKTYKELVQEIETLKAKESEHKAQIVALSESVIKAKKEKAIVKEFSEIFCEKDNKEKALKFKNLSETKRYFEEFHLEQIKALSDNKLLTSKQFHAILSAKMFN